MMEVSPGGGSDRPEHDPQAEGVLFLTAGALQIVVEGTEHKLDPSTPICRRGGLVGAQRRR